MWVDIINIGYGLRLATWPKQGTRVCNYDVYRGIKTNMVNNMLLTSLRNRRFRSLFTRSGG